MDSNKAETILELIASILDGQAALERSSDFWYKEAQRLEAENKLLQGVISQAAAEKEADGEDNE